MKFSQKPSNRSFEFKNIFRALQHRNYRLFFFGQGVSLVGTWMQQVAVSWLVYRMTNSPFLLGVVGFVMLVASAFVKEYPSLFPVGRLLLIAGIVLAAVVLVLG